MQNDIAKFKTTSKFQYKNSNFAPAKTQCLDLALLLLLTAQLAHKTPQNYRPRSIVDALDLHGQTHDPEVALVGRPYHVRNELARLAQAAAWRVRTI